MNRKIHHRFSPSSLYRRKLCPYSVREAEYASRDNTSAQEGTLLHLAVKTENLSGLNEEQKSQVKKCINLKNELKINTYIHIEEMPVVILDAGKQLCYGTPDFIGANDDFVIVADWKFGRNPVTEVENNYQLAAYAAGCMQKWNVNRCDAFIYQPRLKTTPDKFTFTKIENIITSIKNIVFECEKSNPKINPGEVQCQYCNLKENIACPALNGEIIKVAKTIDFPVLPDEKVNEFCDQGKLVEKYIDAGKKEQKIRIEEKGYCGDRIYKEISGGFEITNVVEAWEKVKNYISKEDFLRICSISDIDLKELYCYNRVELNKKDAENEYYNTMGSTREEKNKRKTVVKKKE